MAHGVSSLQDSPWIGKFGSREEMAVYMGILPHCQIAKPHAAGRGQVTAGRIGLGRVPFPCWGWVGAGSRRDALPPHGARSSPFSLWGWGTSHFPHEAGPCPVPLHRGRLELSHTPFPCGAGPYPLLPLIVARLEPGCPLPHSTWLDRALP